MGLFENLPYTNLHELNLSWFLETFKELLREWDEQQQEFSDLNDAWNALHDYVENYFDNLDVQQEINTKLNEMAVSGELGAAMAPYIPDAVGDWLAANLTPTSPPIDKTLAVANSGADSYAAGKRIYNTAEYISDQDISGLADKYGVWIQTDGTEASSGAYRTTSEFFKLPKDALSVKTGNSFYIGATKYFLNRCVLFYDESQNLIGYTPYSGYDYREFNIPDNAVYMKFNQPNISNDGLSNICGGVWLNDGHWVSEVTFANIQDTVPTEIPVRAGVTYRIRAIDGYTPNAGLINIFSNGPGGSAIFARWTTNMVDEFTPAVDGYLSFYNHAGFTGTAKFEVWAGAELEKERKTVKTYYVGPDEAVTSFTEMMLKLKNDPDPKIVYVNGGDYDIWQEYQDLYTAGYYNPTPQNDPGYDPSVGFMPYNIYIPDNTHVIGRGLVRFLYSPAVSDTYVEESKTLSPVNVAGSMILENVEIHAKNCRYCIHDDSLQDAKYNGAIKKYINVKAVKYVADDPNLGTPHNFGCGIAREQRIEAHNCYFETKSTYSLSRTFYVHNRQTVGGVTLTQEMSSNIVLKDCTIISAAANLAVFLGNIGATGLDIRTDIDSCYISGKIVSADEADPSSGSNENTFNISTLLSQYDDLIIRDASNPWPAHEYV